MSLQLERNRKVAIKGVVNGLGKTTLLKTLMGKILNPWTGEMSRFSKSFSLNRMESESALDYF